MPDKDPDADVWSDRIEVYLRQAGIQTIYDKNDLIGGESIEEFVEQKINAADFVMVLYTPDYKVNYEKGTWIRREAELIRERLKTGRKRFFIPVLLSGRVTDSTSPDYLDPSTLHYPMVKNAGQEKSPTDWGECFECLFRILKEKFFPAELDEETQFERIREKFNTRREKIRPVFPHTELHSVRGFFPQSLKSYGAFLDRM